MKKQESNRVDVSAVEKKAVTGGIAIASPTSPNRSAREYSFELLTGGNGKAHEWCDPSGHGCGPEYECNPSWIKG